MMRRLPTTPREPIARFRVASLGFATAIALLNAVFIGISAKIPEPYRVLGCVAAIVLPAWWYWGFRRKHFPGVGWLLEAILLCLIAMTSQLPLRSMGVFYFAIQFRALDVSRRQLPLLILAYTGARFASIALSPFPPPYSPWSAGPVLQMFGMAIIATTLHMLVSATLRQSQIERTLHKSDERYRLLASATRDVIYDWDITTASVEWSESLRAVFGHSPPSGATHGQWWVDLIHPEDRHGFDKTIRTFLANPLDNLDGFRYRVQRADGSYATVSATMLVQRTPEGAPIRVIGSIRDISTEEQLQEQLRESRKMEAVGQLAGGVAHDFNNLLTVIGGHVYMLEHSLPHSAVVERHLDGITAAANRAASLTRQLLAFSRKQILKPTVLNLNTVIDEVGRLITPLLGENIRFIAMLEPNVAPVLADSGQLGQVLINLALNARDAMPNGGTLIMETSNLTLMRGSDEARRTKLPAGEYVRLVTRDSGEGMDAATVARAFEPFFTTKAHGKGTGLGLATAYGIVRQSSGDIWADSIPGAGSTFTLLLPIAGAYARSTDSPTSNRAVPAAPRNSGSEGRRVLLVEDDDGVRDFAYQVLVDAGYRVIMARDGLDGLAAAQRQDYRIDIVVTDVIMPEMGGPAMVAHLRRRAPNMRVLYMTGYTDDDTHISSDLRASAATLLEKPFTSATFLAAFEQARVSDDGAVKA